MKVGQVNSVLFRSSQAVTKPENSNEQKSQLKELSNITPDLAVSVPQKYTLPMTVHPYPCISL